MPISTELTRMAHNVGALNADTNAIFEALRAKGVSVPANAQLSDVADMIESIEVPPLFILLNNCDTLETINGYTQLKSLVGMNLSSTSSNVPGTIGSSSYFTGDNSFYRNESKYIIALQDTPLPSGKITCEIYFSKDTGYFESYFNSNIFCTLRSTSDGIIAIGGENIDGIQLSGNSYLYHWTNTFDAIALDITNISYFHLAGVIDTDTRRVHVFFNGNLLGSYRYPINNQVLKVSTNGQSGQCIEFISIRKGDFSNNLQSFTVPTEKYHL